MTLEASKRCRTPFPARIRPFRGTRLAGTHVDSHSAELRALVRSESDEIAARFEEYLDTGVLLREDAPCFYLTEQEVMNPLTGSEVTRLSLICKVALSGESRARVLPHERIFQSQAQERIEQFKVCPFDLDPVMVFFEGQPSPETAAPSPAPDGSSAPELPDPLERLFSLRSDPPALEIEADVPPAGRTRLRLWAVRESDLDASLLADIQAFFERRDLFIADGHHRFEAALQFQSQGGDGALMMALVSSNDPGLVVLPTHRLVRSTPFADLEELLGVAECDVLWKGELKGELKDGLRRLKSLKGRQRAFAAYDGKLFAILSEKSAEKAALRNGVPEADPGGTGSEADSDAGFFRRVIIEKTLEFDDAAIEERVEFTQSAEEARARVETGEFQFAFLLNPVSVDEIARAAKAGHRLPQKATYFFPKPLKGVLFRPVGG